MYYNLQQQQKQKKKKGKRKKSLRQFHNTKYLSAFQFYQTKLKLMFQENYLDMSLFYNIGCLQTLDFSTIGNTYDSKLHTYTVILIENLNHRYTLNSYPPQYMYW